MLAFDFETGAIQSRPAYPPTPVGLAIDLDPKTPAQYLAWGHPEANDPDPEASLSRAIEVLNGATDIVGHNIAFDLAVAHERMNVPLPEGKHVNDTMFLAFLLDPYGQLGLKPLATRYLGMPPTERDAVREWLETNKVVRRNLKSWGAYISRAPGDLVGKYAVGDVVRTRALFETLLPRVKEAGMMEAYRRECDLVPMLLENSARGVPLNRTRLARDTKEFELIFEKTERALRQCWKVEIGSTPPANFDSNEELADALESGSRGIRLALTPTGKRSVAKATLEDAIPDGRVKGLLLYRSAIQKTLSTYLRPWLEQGKALHCNWNQVRNYDDDGARTGRLSSSPNLQNITNPERYEELWHKMQGWGCAYPWVRFPNLRSYIEAPKGHTLFAIDYSQQELRMLAHFEDDVLAAAYREDPLLDLHEFVSRLIQERTGIVLKRKATKTINFAKVYGAGRAKLAAQLGVDLDTGNYMVDAYEAALPSIAALQYELRAIGRQGDYITTLGGRRYFAEPARIVNGERRSFEYKLLNYLIQGSSADQTKEAMRQWYRRIKGTDTRFLLTVHDEIVGCCPGDNVKREVAHLRECMEGAFSLDVPVGTDATVGKRYGAMKRLQP